MFIFWFIVWVFFISWAMVQMVSEKEWYDRLVKELTKIYEKKNPKNAGWPKEVYEA